jgi:hypothetical protein
MHSGQRSMSPVPRSSLIIDCIRTAARSASIDGEALLREVEAANDVVRKPGPGKRDERRWVDECVKSQAQIYVNYTGRKIGFTNCEAETRFERFVRLVIMSDDQKHSRNLLKTAIRRFNQKQSQDRNSGIAVAAE